MVCAFGFTSSMIKSKLLLSLFFIYTLFMHSFEFLLCHRKSEPTMGWRERQARRYDFGYCAKICGTSSASLSPHTAANTLVRSVNENQ